MDASQLLQHADIAMAKRGRLGPTIYTASPAEPALDEEPAAL